MPQVIAVWAEELGHGVHYRTYTGMEDLSREVPDEIDLLFVCAFTPAAYLAYGLSNFYRKKNVVTVLGGPHARSFPQDASRYFDYVTGFVDKPLIKDLLQGFSAHPGQGQIISAAKQPLELPGVQQRWRFIKHNLDKSKLIRMVPVLGSLGCPYKCNFCVDAQVDYQPLPYDQIKADLAFVQKELKNPFVGWHDPNFGVRFDDYMNLIEGAVKPGSVRFAAESSLSLLGQEHLERLEKNNFLAMLVGLESWFDYNNKAKQGKRSGMEKVQATAEHVNLICKYIPYVQVNFIFGLDVDAGPEPFEATKRFIDLAPAAVPVNTMFTSYGNSAPLDVQLQKEGRVLNLPFHFVDGQSAPNIRFKNYTYPEFFDYYVDLFGYTNRPRVAWRRFCANQHSLRSGPRWAQLIRAKGVFGKGRYGYFKRWRHLLATDRELQRFYEGNDQRVPSFFSQRIKADLGFFYDHLPAGVANYLEGG